jgi:Fe-S cluster assembly iron-binding protein IscA
VSVDTYVGRRNTSNYQVVKQDGVEVLVSKALAPFIDGLRIDTKQWLFMRSLKVQLDLQG